MLVADDLRRLAATPRHRWLGDSIQDRAYVLYWCLIIGLITRNGSLDPEGNIQALMVKIATNRSIDLFRTERRHVAHQVPLTEDQALPGGDTDLETHVADHSHEAAVIAATFAYWASLPWPDGEIMRLRHATNSTNLRPFVSIAAHLGPRHKPNTVQHIYYRTLERTREHLRSLGLLDDEGAD
jgi:hypothetical protein